ncbi:MAG TPA: S8 family peptidase [Bdellovibrionales bacterium]|nr:S8 family peptidase [Bdellovibrionales bacterium]
MIKLLRSSILAAAVLGITGTAAANSDLLVKLKPNASERVLAPFSAKAERIADEWYKLPARDLTDIEIAALEASPAVAYVQPNYKLSLMHDFRAKDPAVIKQLEAMKAKQPGLFRASSGDNPPYSTVGAQSNGSDPMYAQQWGMKDIGVSGTMHSAKNIVVAVIDTGVDYTHEDLAPNMWINQGENGKDAQGRSKRDNGVDDDGNGYVDDVVGWDFAANDSKPYDLTVGKWSLVLTGGNPGHGTHCAGNVGARANNKLGIMGVAGDVQIMAIRFLNERGMGDTAGAVRAIRYAVDNGAKILSNSWGSEGENPADQTNNEALKDAIRYANSKGVLFIAAAGNGHMGKGYDNDIDERPAYPASYDIENIVSVAAIDNLDKLGKFSNWGKKRVHIAAPGVNVFSTVPGKEKYTNKAVHLLFGIISATWDGTSMATPHVAGAAALYWAKNPNKSVAEVKAALLSSAKKTETLNGKVVSDGKLHVGSLLGQ